LKLANPGPRRGKRGGERKEHLFEWKKAGKKRRKKKN